MKMLLATVPALSVAGCSVRRLLFKQPAAVAPKETITHHFFVSGIGQKKTVDVSQNLYMQKMLLKRNLANIRKMDCWFYY